MLPVNAEEKEAYKSKLISVVLGFFAMIAATLLVNGLINLCLLYTSDAADERSSVDLGGRRIINKKKKEKKKKKKNDKINDRRPPSRTQL